MRIADFDYELPPERIASRPLPERDAARLLVLDQGQVDHRTVRELPTLLPTGALLVVNNTRVIPARLLGHRPQTGGRVEIFLVERLDGAGATERWKCLGRANRPLRPDARIDIDGGDLSVTVRERHDDGATLVAELTTSSGSVEKAIERCGRVPLPPYVHREAEPEDRQRYQTVFAERAGSAAAPTAGLHLSERLLSELADANIELASITLHVGLGTFQPVSVDDLDDHRMHEEWCEIPATLNERIAAAEARGAPVVAVGTTVVRALESAALRRDAAQGNRLQPGAHRTSLLIQPGFSFQVVDQLLTNFHLPQSTLLALVSAFGGRGNVLAAYRLAVQERYRFFSYGDAMLLRSRCAPEEAAR